MPCWLLLDFDLGFDFALPLMDLGFYLQLDFGLDFTDMDLDLRHALLIALYFGLPSPCLVGCFWTSTWGSTLLFH